MAYFSKIVPTLTASQTPPAPEAPNPRRTPLTSQDPLKSLLAPLLNALDTQSRSVISLRFALLQGSFPLTLEEIAAKLSTTRERVRRIEKLALETLRKTAGATLLTALKQEAENRREALIEETGEGQPEELPSRFGTPWSILAAAVCGVTTDEWKRTGNH